MQDRSIVDLFTAIVVVLLVVPLVIWALLSSAAFLPVWMMHLAFLLCLSGGIRTAVKSHDKPVLCLALAIGVVLLIGGYAVAILSQHYGMLDD